MEYRVNPIRRATISRKLYPAPRNFPGGIAGKSRKLELTENASPFIMPSQLALHMKHENHMIVQSPAALLSHSNIDC